jgi:hypothetical protein
MINSLTGGLEFRNIHNDADEADIEKISQIDINANFNPVPSL